MRPDLKSLGSQLSDTLLKPKFLTIFDIATKQNVKVYHFLFGRKLHFSEVQRLTFPIQRAKNFQITIDIGVNGEQGSYIFIIWKKNLKFSFFESLFV